MKSFEEIKSIYDEEKKGFDVEKEKPEKFLISLELFLLTNTTKNKPIISTNTAIIYLYSIIKSNI